MDAPRDDNFIPAKMGVLNTNGTTLIPIKINESNNGMMVNTTDTVQFTMTPIAPEDENFDKVMLFQGTDGLTYPWVVDSEGKVLINYI